MTPFQYTSLMLMLIVVLDAAGDAFRLRRKQFIHHGFEVLAVATWFILLLGKHDFVAIHLVMYVLIRIAIFDVTFNLISGLPIKHIGSSSIWDTVMRWFIGWAKEPGFLLWVIRALALYWWLTWFFTNAGGRI